VLSVLANLTLIAYACATGLALAYLVQREEMVHRLGHLAMLAGWVIHSVSLIVLAVETRRPPLGSLSEAVSTAVWVVVLVTMLVERQYRMTALSAFVMPVVLVLSLKSTAARPATLEQLGDTFRSAWIWIHIALALIGIAAFVLNFAGATMYLLQERQLKAKRPGTFYYRLPDLQTLDRSRRTPYYGPVMPGIYISEAAGGGLQFPQERRGEAAATYVLSTDVLIETTH